MASFKILMLAGALTGCSFLCQAQPYHNSAGARWGKSSGFSFRQMQNEKHAIEALLTFRWGGPVVTGLYERSRHIGSGNFYWYYGGGLHMGYNRRFRQESTGTGRRYVNVGMDVIVGMEYIIPSVPITITLDLKPALSFTASEGHTDESLGLSLRYYW